MAAGSSKEDIRGEAYMSLCFQRPGSIDELHLGFRTELFSASSAAAGAPQECSGVVVDSGYDEANRPFVYLTQLVIKGAASVEHGLNHHMLLSDIDIFRVATVQPAEVLDLKSAS